MEHMEMSIYSLTHPKTGLCYGPEWLKIGIALQFVLHLSHIEFEHSI
jgi:hypothetical protein